MFLCSSTGDELIFCIQIVEMFGNGGKIAAENQVFSFVLGCKIRTHQVGSTRTADMGAIRFVSALLFFFLWGSWSVFFHCSLKGLFTGKTPFFSTWRFFPPEVLNIAWFGSFSCLDATIALWSWLGSNLPLDLARFTMCFKKDSFEVRGPHPRNLVFMVKSWLKLFSAVKFLFGDFVDVDMFFTPTFFCNYPEAKDLECMLSSLQLEPNSEFFFVRFQQFLWSQTQGNFLESPEVCPCHIVWRSD